MDADEAQRRAETAQRILDEPMVQEAFDEIERVVRDQFMDLKAGDVKAFQELAHIRDVTKRFRSVFEAALTKGTVAKHDVMRKQRFGFR